MKKILSVIALFVVGIVSVFAYTPSDNLIERMDVVVEKFDEIIDVKGESYRVSLLNVIDTYMTRYVDSERATYILEYLYENLNTSSVEISYQSGELSQEFIETEYADSLVGDVEIVDCTLSGGRETSCYKFTVAPDATIDHEIGPWCPTNITDSDLAGGIWPKDGEIYQVSGEFIENLAVLYSDDSWQLFDTESGEISVTDTQVSCEGAAKPNVEEEYQNHCVECSLTYMDEIPNVTYTIPMDPEITESTQNVDGSIGTGVSFNGTKFDASAPVQNIIAANTIAAFDDCGGHINLNAGYHYHETTGCSKEVELLDNHEGMIGLAFDGFPMFTQTDETVDACGGHTDDGVYHYHVSKTGTNAFLGCYAAEYGCSSTDPDAVCDASASSNTQGGGGGGGGAGGPPGDRPPR